MVDWDCKMDSIDQKINLIADFCGKKIKHNSDRLFAKAIGELLGAMYADSKNKESNVDDFISTLKDNQINESIGDVIKGMSVGALLAACLINPANAKVIVDNIKTHHPVVAKYESGKKGYDCIVKDNYGGYSYGKYQISTERRDGNPSTFDYFMKYLKEHDKNIEYHLRKAGGWEAASIGDPVFIAKWCEMTFRKDFQDAYNNFLRDNEYIPVYKRMDKSGNKTLDKITTWASQNNAVQAAINSAIIQHGKGGAYSLLRNVIKKYKVTSAEQFLNALYKERAVQYPKYKTRYKDEGKDVKNYYKSPESTIK